MDEIRSRIENALERSGVEMAHWANSVNTLFERLGVLYRTGRYSGLFRDLGKCNDKSNLRSLLLEINFAYCFESQEQPLTYEVQQVSRWASTVDFLWHPLEDFRVFLEIRLIQQRWRILEKIRQQLAETEWFKVFLTGSDQQKEITRVQDIILSKCQNSRGKPTKFFTVNPGEYNIIVADVSQPLLNMIDRYDCRLATYGDQAVDQVYRRGIFGIFQEPNLRCSDDLKISRRFLRLRNVIHGILFLKKRRNADPIVFNLGHYFLPNNRLLGNEQFAVLRERLAAVLEAWAD